MTNYKRFKFTVLLLSVFIYLLILYNIFENRRNDDIINNKL